MILLWQPAAEAMYATRSTGQDVFQFFDSRELWAILTKLAVMDCNSSKADL